MLYRITLLLFFALGFLPAQITNPGPVELARLGEILDRIPKVDLSQVEVEATTSEIATATSSIVVPPRSRVGTTEGPPNQRQGPKVVLYFPQGWRIQPSRGEKVEATLVALQELGRVILVQDFTPVIDLLLSNSKPRIYTSRKVIRTTLQLGDEIRLKEHMLEFEEPLLYLHRVVVIIDDPQNRRPAVETFHLVKSEVRYHHTEVIAKIPPIFPLLNPILGWSSSGRGLTVTFAGFLSQSDATQMGWRQYLFIPGMGGVTRPKPNGVVVTAPITVPGIFDAVIVTMTEDGNRITCHTSPQVIDAAPGYFINR